MKDLLLGSARIYRANPLFAIPPTLLFAVNSSVLAFSTSYPQNESAKLLLLPLGLGFTVLLSLTSLFVILGLAGMSAKATLGNRVRIRDWLPKSWRHFYSVLGLGIIFLVVVSSLFTITGLSFVLLALQGSGSINILLSPSSLERLIPGSTNSFRIMNAFVGSIAQTAFFLWLAAVLIDDRRAPDALALGVRRIREARREVWLLIMFVFLVSTLSTMIEVATTSPFPFLSYRLLDRLPVSTLASQALSNFSYPLWVLMAFRIYRESTDRSDHDDNN